MHGSKLVVVLWVLVSGAFVGCGSSTTAGYCQKLQACGQWPAGESLALCEQGAAESAQGNGECFRQYQEALYGCIAASSSCDFSACTGKAPACN